MGFHIYRRLGRVYWDTLSSTQLVLAYLWSFSYAVGSFLALVGGVLRAKVEAPSKRNPQLVGAARRVANPEQVRGSNILKRVSKSERNS